MIYTFIPYALEKENFGNSCNDYFKLLGDDDWGAFITYDQMFLTPHWLEQLYQAIEDYPDIGMFTCMTNRIGCPLQKAGVDESNHDIRYHREIAEDMREKKGVKLWKDTGHKVSGHFMLLSKKAWEQAGGFRNGFMGVDNDMHRALERNKIPVGIIEGLYIYHWYRA